MLFPVLAPSISATSSAHSDSASPTSTRRRLSFPLLSNSESTDSNSSSSPRLFSNWFGALKRRNSNESTSSAELEAKLVKSVTKLDRKERERREKATKKLEKEQRVRARREQDARAYAAWLEEQKLYYATPGSKTGDNRRTHDEEFFPHGVWTGAYLF
ncbi:hypothetical protein JCM3765_002330 [Sporobolomyces pararoseus]